MKLSQILKYAGIILGVVFAWIILAPVVDVLAKQKILIFLLGLCAAVYFVGVWLKKKGK
jgi:F0F1-type ATP synthase assembly protein I